MTKYIYTAKTKKGEIRNGKIEATSEEVAMIRLQQKGLVVSMVRDEKSVRSFEEQMKRLIGIGTVKPEDLLTFSRQMRTMMRSGVPIIRSLTIVQESTKSEILKNALKDMVRGLEGGKSLAQCMQSHPMVFPQIMISMIHVAETTGKFDESFEQISDYISKDTTTRRRVKSATRYPMFVMIAITGAIVIINIYVIPSFTAFFKSFGAKELPLPTRILMESSNITIHYWPYILAVVIGFIMWFVHYKNSPDGSVSWGRIVLKMPVMGRIFEQSLLARFARTLAMTLGSGVPLLQALTIVSKAVDNPYVQQRILLMRSGLERGESLVQTARASRLFTPLVMQMLAIGEETGEVDAMLRQVAETYDTEVDYALSGLSSAIEPILISVIAVIVLVLALGIFLPMWDMSSVAMH